MTPSTTPSATPSTTPPRVLVVGASRGIGLEFVRQYREAGAQVTATARSDEGLARIAALGARALRLDVAGADGASALAWPIDGEAFDVAIVNAGVYGPRTQGLQTPTAAEFDAVMHTNVLGAMRVLPQLADALAPLARLAVISSRMASIGARGGASGWLYRASKAALNSVLKDASLALAGRAVCVALHPGWVRTDMGGPSAAISVEESAAGLKKVLTGVGPGDTGKFFNYDGSEIAW
jgi:NAD(P)-dependent dehydrogenase (short-subunit alcohol dehydrogenase family)